MVPPVGHASAKIGKHILSLVWVMTHGVNRWERHCERAIFWIPFIQVASRLLNIPSFYMNVMHLSIEKYQSRIIITLLYIMVCWRSEHLLLSNERIWHYFIYWFKTQQVHCENALNKKIWKLGFKMAYKYLSFTKMDESSFITNWWQDAKQLKKIALQTPYIMYMILMWPPIKSST